MGKRTNNQTLFLDRDGVINERIPGAYIERIEQFKFTNNCLEAMSMFNDIFSRIFVVTNQQGIGKEIMTELQLFEIHDFMKEKIVKAGGRIDEIYFCPDLAEKKPKCRKPKSRNGFTSQKRLS